MYISTEWRELKGSLEKKGYRRVGLCLGKKCRNWKVHVLVLTAFVGPCPKGMQACHFPDRNGSNNRLDNLRWDTPKSNSDDKERHGTRAKGTAITCAKLNPNTVQSLREEFATGSITVFHLAKKYGVSRSVLRDAIYRRTWRHVK